MIIQHTDGTKIELPEAFTPEDAIAIKPALGKGWAIGRMVQTPVFEPVGEKPAAVPARTKDDEAELVARVLAFVESRGDEGVVTAAVATFAGCSNNEVSRIKAKLLKAGKLDPTAKKGTLRAVKGMVQP